MREAIFEIHKLGFRNYIPFNCYSKQLIIPLILILIFLEA